MARNLCVAALLTLLAGVVFPVPSSAQGVYIVQKKDVPSFEEVKNNFIQQSFVEQIPGLVTQPIYLDGGAGDAAALGSLAEKRPGVVFAIGSYAAKKVRETLPEALIVTAMVYYPEMEKFNLDQRMVVVASLGPARELMDQLKAFRKVKKVAILHSSQISESIESFSSDLRSQGAEVSDLPVASAQDMAAALEQAKAGKVQAVLVLPDPVTQGQESVRFIVTKCIEGDMLPVSLNENMVSSGVFFSVFYPIESVGQAAVKLVKEMATTGRMPPSRVQAPAAQSSSLNRGTLNAFKLKIPANLKIGVVYE